MQAPRLITGPSVSAMDSFTFDAHARLGHPDDGNVISAVYLPAAVQRFDGWSGILKRALVTQTWAVSFPAFSAFMRLPLGPVQSVSSVAYFDNDNATQTADASSYRLHRDAIGDYIVPVDSWPSTYSRDDAVTVEWVAGYGDTASSVPAPIRSAILLTASHLYENREDSIIGVQSMPIPMGAQHLVAPFCAVVNS